MLVTRLAHIVATAAGVAVAAYIEPYAAHPEAAPDYPTPIAHSSEIERTSTPWAVMAESQADSHIQNAPSGAAGGHAEGGRGNGSLASDVSNELSALESASSDRDGSSSLVLHSSQFTSHTNAAATHGAPSLALAIALSASCLLS